MKAQYDIEQDLYEAKIMADGLEEYIKSDQIYGRPGGMFSTNSPVLTIGGLMMRIRRLNTFRERLSDVQRFTLDSAIAENNRVYTEWTVHYEQKVIAEAHSRMDAMQLYFQEYNSDPEKAILNYRPEAMRRTIVEELFIHMQRLNIVDKALANKVKSVDHSLRSIVETGEFLLAPALKAFYGPKEFWWLYRQPVEHSQQEATT